MCGGGGTELAVCWLRGLLRDIAAARRTAALQTVLSLGRVTDLHSENRHFLGPFQTFLTPS